MTAEIIFLMAFKNRVIDIYFRMYHLVHFTYISYEGKLMFREKVLSLGMWQLKLEQDCFLFGL